MRVEVYFNLHRNLFSVLHKGRVVRHSADVSLVDCKFVVRQAGRERVLREGRKNVHAFVRGTLVDEVVEASLPVTYNPYRDSSFVRCSDRAPVSTARSVRLSVVGGRPNVFANFLSGIDAAIADS